MKEPIKNVNKFSLNKKYQSFTYALFGLKTFAREEHNFWSYIFGILFSIVLGVFFNIDRYEWIVQFLIISFIFSSELMNTAVENVVDLASPQHHTMAKKVKDLASASVLLSALGSFIIFLIIYIPKFLIFF